MEVRVQGGAHPTPFLRARDAFETEYELQRPVKVYVKDDPDERTWTAHDPDSHVLNISRSAASSAMARELAIHEFAHMYRHEQGHVSHRQSTAEAILLSAAGRRIPKRRLAQCYQIANHMKDIYADDLTLEVTDPRKLVSYLESAVATGVLEGAKPKGPLSKGASEPDRLIQAVNAAFAVGLCERHDCLDPDHRLLELAQIAAAGAPALPYDRVRDQFRTLETDPDRSQYRRSLVEATKTFLNADQAEGTKSA